MRDVEVAGVEQLERNHRVSYYASIQNDADFAERLRRRGQASTPHAHRHLDHLPHGPPPPTTTGMIARADGQTDRMVGLLDRARASFARSSWGEAFTAYAQAAEQTALHHGDLERLAVSAYLVGEDDASEAAWQQAHLAALDAEDPATAARCGFWLGFCLLLRGQAAHARGWLARTERLIEDHALDCVASGYLLIPGVLTALDRGDPSEARQLAVEATELGHRFGDPDLLAFAALGHAQALLADADIRGGTSGLDEVMVSVTMGEVGPITTGIIYCAVLLECVRLFDLQRAAEWTDALTAWCDAQPDLVPFRGQCLVHRSQVQQAAGDWTTACSTADAARQRLTDPPHPALGLAWYQRAELHRLMGAFDDAEVSYREASRHGHQPMPGLALLELARGHSDRSARTLRRPLHDTFDPLARAALLTAAVEILRAAHDLTGARNAADELTAIAAGSPSPALGAMAAQATGSVLLGEGKATAALARLRAAASTWQSLPVPYEAARTGVSIGLACAALGDDASARIELANARATFVALGAAPDLDALAQVAVATAATGDALLSNREREVLAHVAAGLTNAQIAERLVISPHTVGRHLDNIFIKLGVNSRAAATAYAYQHDLL